LNWALGAPEAKFAMLLLSVSSQGCFRIEASITAQLGALESSDMEVLLADVHVECISFPEALSAILTSKSVCSIVDSLMAL
jgi:hypothetical protein